MEPGAWSQRSRGLRCSGPSSMAVWPVTDQGSESQIWSAASVSPLTEPTCSTMTHRWPFPLAPGEFPRWACLLCKKHLSTTAELVLR